LALRASRTKTMAEWIAPFADSRITGHYGTMSEYRKRNKMQPHSGTDWAVRAGTLIPAITD
jgi:murein DD-endopeptidase MepM/ murein hydrolase activator NlpD